MNTLNKWKNDAMHLAERHETALTVLLVLVALVLIGVAIFGKSHHKAMAMAYIVL